MADADIIITHTREAGTLVEGTAKGDGSAAPLKAAGFRWSRNLGSWYLPHSRDRAAKRWDIDRAASGLREAGFTVETDIDDLTPGRSFAEAEEERAWAAFQRAERFSGRADGAAGHAEALESSARERADRIPFGQPILIGHHSEGRDRRYRERIHNTFRKAYEEGKRAEYWAGRAEAAEHWEQHRNNIPRTLRRIEKLEADERRLSRQIAEAEGKGLDQTRERLGVDRDYVAEQLQYWRGVVAEAEARGVKVWSAADFTKGDFARLRWGWFEVLRVNKKTVTVPHIHNGIGVEVVTADMDEHGHTYTIPYDEITDRLSAEAAAERFGLDR